MQGKGFLARVYDTGEDGLIISGAGVAISLRSKEVLARLPKGASHLSMTQHPDDPWILAGTFRESGGNWRGVRFDK